MDEMNTLLDKQIDDVVAKFNINDEWLGKMLPLATANSMREVARNMLYSAVANMVTEGEESFTVTSGVIEAEARTVKEDELGYSEQIVLTLKLVLRTATNSSADFIVDKIIE